MKHLLAFCQLFILLALTSPLAQAAGTQLSEKDYYKMMYEQAAASASTAQTITWSTLGIVVGLFAVALIAQAVSNAQLNTGKLNTLRAEIEKQSASEIAAGINALRTEIQELVTGQQRALLKRISSDATTNRDAINRELDTYKSSLGERLLSQSQEISRAKAEILMLKNLPTSAFEEFLALCEAAIEAGQPPRDTHGLLNSLVPVKEIELTIFERVQKILEHVAYPEGLVERALAATLAGMRVYKHIPTPGQPTAQMREYIENPLSKKG
jgi:hypothetical protein